MKEVLTGEEKHMYLEIQVLFPLSNGSCVTQTTVATQVGVRLWAIVKSHSKSL